MIRLIDCPGALMNLNCEEIHDYSEIEMRNNKNKYVQKWV